jgi:hypothetical protein
MMSNVTYDKKNSNRCAAPERERLNQQPTIGRLLNELHVIYQRELEEHPISQVTKDFKKNLDTLEKAYKDEITKIVDDYQKEYDKTFRLKLERCEDYYKKLVSLTNDKHNPGPDLRAAINELREQSYNAVEKNLKNAWDCAWDDLENGNCCQKQAQESQNKAQEEFEYYKKYREYIASLFQNLDDLEKEAERHQQTENYKALYAYRLEYHSILEELRHLKKDETMKSSPDTSILKDHEWLKSVLTTHLWNYCIATYESFYWQRKWEKLKEKETKARADYKSFQETRRNKFIREAQDVVPVKDDPNCDDSPKGKTNPYSEKVASRYSDEE